MNKKVIIIVIVVIVIGGGIYFWLQREATETKIESSIEKATGGQADVDISDKSVKVNTNTGSFSAGESVSLPSGFPSDVHVVDGTITAVTTMTEIDGYSVSIQTSKTVTAVKEEYESKLKADGWTITMSLVIQGGATIGGEKDNRTVTVSISEDDDGKAFVILGTSTNQE